jgi:hypothetical protein
MLRYRYRETLTREDAAEALIYDCVNGLLRGVQWLKDAFKLGPESARKAPMLSCHNGQLKSLQFLADSFAFASDDAEAALDFCRARDRFGCSPWLCEHFGRSAEISTEATSWLASAGGWRAAKQGSR